MNKRRVIKELEIVKGLVAHKRIATEDFTVDFKWGCWLSSTSDWNNYAPGVWEAMEAAFVGDARPVKIRCQPKKENRYGMVTIKKGGAEGWFSTGWDDIPEIADTLGFDEDAEDYKEQLEILNESLPYSLHIIGPGLDQDFRLSVKNFDNLMDKIDLEEDRLVKADEKAWREIERAFKQ